MKLARTDPVGFETRVTNWLRHGGRVLLVADFDGTQSDIVPHDADARMQPAALRAADIFLSEGPKKRLTYAVMTGRSAESLLARVADSAREQCTPEEAARLNQLFSESLPGGFYHGMTLRQPTGSGEAAATGFNRHAREFAPALSYLRNIRDSFNQLLSSFNAAHPEHTLTVQEMPGGYEVNFRSVQDATRDPAILSDLRIAKLALLTSLHTHAHEIPRDAHDRPLLALHAEYDRQYGTFAPGADEEYNHLMSIALQPAGFGDKATALHRLVKSQRVLEPGKRPLLVVFAGDSLTGTDRAAFQSVRKGLLGDAAISVQVLRQGAARGNIDADKRPDYVYRSPQEFSAALLNIAQAMRQIEPPAKPSFGKQR